MKKLLIIIGSILMFRQAEAQVNSRCPVCPPSLRGVPDGYALRDSSGYARWQSVAGFDTTAIGVDSLSNLFWNINGNAGTDTATNFIGTTDSKSLLVKTNGTTRFNFEAGGNISSPFNPTLNRFLLGSPFTGGYLLFGDTRDLGGTSNFAVAKVNTVSIIDTSAFAVKSINGTVGMDGFKFRNSTFGGFYAFHNGEHNATSNIYTQNIYSDGSIGRDRNRIQCDSSGIHMVQWSHNIDTTTNYKNGFVADTIKGEWFIERYGNEHAQKQGKGMLLDSAHIEYFVRGVTKFSVDTNGSVSIIDGTQSNGYVLTSDANGLASWKGLGGSNGSDIPAYANNAAAFAVLGAGKLYYTDVAGEYILKVTH